MIFQFSKSECPLGEHKLERRLLQAMSLYHAFDDGRFSDVDVQQPIPRGDPVYECPNTGLHTIVCAWRDDPGFDHKISSRDTVADGNKVLTRKLLPGEKPFKRMYQCVCSSCLLALRYLCIRVKASPRTHTYGTVRTRTRIVGIRRHLSHSERAHHLMPAHPKVDVVHVTSFPGAQRAGRGRWQ